MNHGLDTDTRVCFYEQDFYVLSNFSAFRVSWTSGDNPWRIKSSGNSFDTAEHAYQSAKFAPFPDEPSAWDDLVSRRAVWVGVCHASSAHLAFKIAEENKRYRHPDWDNLKLDVMRGILRAKADQHEYVRRKLLQTEDRELVENSWRDAFWGWGPNQDGQNMLGNLWMEIRAELRSQTRATPCL